MKRYKVTFGVTYEFEAKDAKRAGRMAMSYFENDTECESLDSLAVMTVEEAAA